MERVLNVILTHQSADAVARMLEWWRELVDVEGVLIVHGGKRADFDAVTHPQKVFVDDPRLHTVDHQREYQSYSGVFSAVAEWLAGRDFSHVSFCEYDHLPLVADFNARQLARLREEDADVLGYQVRRLDDTCHPHYLFHHSNPEFHRYWETVTCRPDPSVILSMFGSGSFWTREAFVAVASGAEPFRIYLELYLPTLAHHLGFRVRDFAEQNAFIHATPDCSARIEAARRTGAWSVHPVKHWWTSPPPHDAPRSSPAGSGENARIMLLPALPAAGSVSMLRHWRELDHGFRADPPADLDFTCPLGLPPGLVPTAGRFSRAWQKYRTYPRLLRSAEPVRVVHILDHSFAHLLESVPAGTRKIVTVHDLAPLADGSLTDAQQQRFQRTISWLKHADLLLCDSAFTARIVRDFVGPGVRIEVLLLGVNTDAFQQPRPFPKGQPLPPGPRLLSIGSCLARKNLGVLPRIIESVVREVGPVSLLRVGEPLPDRLRAELQAILPPGHFVEYGSASDEDLVAIYQASDVLVFPSTLEGFGLPLIEAMAAGCAVVSSRASSLPEVGDDAALYFDPQDPAEATTAIVALLRDPARRAALTARGRERSRELSWQHHIRQLAEIYRRVMAR